MQLHNYFIFLFKRDTSLTVFLSMINSLMLVFPYILVVL